MPRLLLLEPGSPAPERFDPTEDWIRLPATQADIEARRRLLADRLGVANGSAASPDAPDAVGESTVADDRPHLDGSDVLWYGGSWVAVPPVEAALLRELIANFGGVTARDVLTQAAWPGGGTARNALDVRILRLRRRMEPVGLAIRTIRSQGYLLESA